jgi:catechol 2,3-dioxygenase-like lactoylglutathione lyase family enzyme
MAEFTFHHGGVSVPSLEEAIDWYARVLGFTLEKQFYIAAAKSHTAMVRKGPLRFEIFEVEGASPLPDDRRHPPQDLATHGNKHVAFRVESLDSFLVEMAERQADIALVVREAFGKSCFIRDCAGNLIEFVEEDVS